MTNGKVLKVITEKGPSLSIVLEGNLNRSREEFSPNVILNFSWRKNSVRAMSLRQNLRNDAGKRVTLVRTRSRSGCPNRL